MRKPEAGSVLVLVGTKKGGFIFHAGPQRKNWKLSGPYYKGSHPIYHMAFDPRDDTIYAALNSETWGTAIYESVDYGESWKKLKSQPTFGKKSKLKVKNLWHIEPGLKSTPDRLYVGVDPAGLFVTEDRGRTWEPVEALNNHKTRRQWSPGAGGMCLHSIVLDPNDPRKMYVGISAAGVFRTTNDGENWEPVNKRTRADFLPNKYPLVGQCVHKVAFHSARPNVLYQQNHCGVYRTDSYGDEWIDIGRGLPSSYGFPIVVHPREAETIYVVPEESDESHVPPNGHFAVYRSRNSGRTWERLDRGLPTRDAYLGVLREGMAVDGADLCGIYVGTNTGQLFYSVNEGENWQLLAEWLPPIYSVSCGLVS